jgi:hypothetical protein
VRLLVISTQRGEEFQRLAARRRAPASRCHDRFKIPAVKRNAIAGANTGAPAALPVHGESRAAGAGTLSCNSADEDVFHRLRDRFRPEEVRIAAFGAAMLGGLPAAR